MKELLFFDLKCRQENGNHEPNLCVVQNEAGEVWIFQGYKTIDEFCEWLFTTEHAGCTVMAHNFQGYDSYFILQYLRKQGVKYNVIMRGAKVLSLKVELFDIRFIDSPVYRKRLGSKNLPKVILKTKVSSFLQQERQRELRGTHSTSDLLQSGRHESEK